MQGQVRLLASRPVVPPACFAVSVPLSRSSLSWGSTMKVGLSQRPVFPARAQPRPGNTVCMSAPWSLTWFTGQGKRKALPVIQKLSLSIASLQKFWISLSISKGDVFISLACLILPGVILRFCFRVYMFFLKQLDRRVGSPIKIYRPKAYKESMFYTIESAGLLQLGGGLSLTTICLRIIFGAGKRLHISDPISAKGGTPLRFQRFATVVFWGFALAKVKKRLLRRGDVGGFRTTRQRFVIDRVSDVAIAVLVTLACFDAVALPIGSLAAAGGVGGLVVGLASKEVVENLFGGVALLFTSPFSPGDVVTTPKFSGRISNIGFYTTSVVDFEGCVTLIPNSLLTNQVVTNLTRARRRRFSSRYMLRYEDLAAVPKIAEQVRDSIQALPLTDRGAYVRSHLTRFGPHALILEAQCLVTTNSRDVFLDFQQDALLCISQAVKDAGASFATEFALSTDAGKAKTEISIEQAEGD